MEDDLNSELDILNRIVTLLLALAGMAERACGRSSAICAFMVWILRPAEAAISAYADLSPDMMPAPFVRIGDAREDAARLARRFRMLAHQMIREAEFALHYATGKRSETHESHAPSPRFHPFLDPVSNLVRWAENKWQDTS